MDYGDVTFAMHRCVTYSMYSNCVSYCNTVSLDLMFCSSCAFTFESVLTVMQSFKLIMVLLSAVFPQASVTIAYTVLRVTSL